MTILLLAVAIAPGIAIAIYVYKRDKYEKEPLGLLVKCFVFGALAGFPAGFAEDFTFELLGIDLDAPTDLFTAFYAAFFLVGFTEESVKYWVLTRYAFSKPAFNEPFDGIVYSVMIGLGFATLENVFYVMDGGWGVAALRMFTAVPMHAVFGVLMGYYVGIAKFQHASHRMNSLIKGLGFAILLHGSYDFVLFQNATSELTKIILIVPLIIFGIIISLKAIRAHSDASPFKNQDPADPDQ